MYQHSLTGRVCRIRKRFCVTLGCATRNGTIRETITRVFSFDNNHHNGPDEKIDCLYFFIS